MNAGFLPSILHLGRKGDASSEPLKSFSKNGKREEKNFGATCVAKGEIQTKS